MKKINWKIKFGILLIITSALLYLFAYLALGEPHKVIFYIVIDLAFIPLDVLIVVLVIEGIIDKKEKENIIEKLDMILGVFFSEVGDNLLETFSKANECCVIIDDLKHAEKWTDKDFNRAYKYLKNNGIKFQPNIPDEEKKVFINNLRSFLHLKRDFLIRLVENPNLLEKDSFSGLILDIFHLHDELELRTNLDKVSSADFNHIMNDIDRVYSRLTYEWIVYLQYLNKNYTYLSSIAIRKNPFNPEAEVYIND